MCSRTVVLALLVASCAFQAFADEQTSAEKLEAAGFTYLGPFIGTANVPMKLFISKEDHLLNFTAALKYCTDSAAKLVAVERVDQQQYINIEMANKYSMSSPPAWTSALYNPGQEIWVWRSVNRKMEYHFWQGGSPPTSPKGGDCGYIQADFYDDAVLVSLPCNIPLQFICEVAV